MARRRWVSAESATFNALVLIAAAALVGAAVVSVARGAPTATSWARGTVVGVVVAFLLSGRFSTRLLRVFLVLAAAVAVVGVAGIGRAETASARGEDGRVAAGTLQAQLDGPAPVYALPAPVAARSTEEATEAVDVLVRAAGRLVDDPTGRTNALAVADGLRAILRGGAGFDEVRRQVRDLPAPELVAAATNALEAVVAVVAPPAAKPSDGVARAAVKDLCTHAGGAFLTQLPSTCDRTEGSVQVAFLPQYRARAELEVARHALAMASGDARKALQSEVAGKETAYAAAVGGRADGVEGVELWDTLRIGVAETLSRIPGVGHAAARPDVPISVGVIGWTALGALVLAGYRWLDRRTAENAIGPVEVKVNDGDKDPDPKDADRFRTYVLRNIPDPGAVPGASPLQPVTDLLGATGNVAAGMISKALGFLVVASKQRHGYTIMVRTLTPTKAVEAKPAGPQAQPEGEPAVVGGKAVDSRPTARVAVRVNEARTGALVEQTISTGATPDLALRSAAYWAAAVVLDRSDRVPGWARWSGATAASLAAFYASEDTGEGRLKDMVEAVKKTPTSGVLCLSLSHQYAVEGDHFAAFELALRAAALNQRFVAARYRLAVCASLLASDMDANWWRRAEENRTRVLAALARYPNDRRLHHVLRDRPSRTQAPVEALCDFAIAELDAVLDLLNGAGIPFKALRRSERSYWLGFLRRDKNGRTGRAIFEEVVRSAKPAVEQRRNPRDEAPLIVGDDRSSWQVSYNAACCAAVRFGATTEDPDATRAMEQLETARERPRSHQLTKGWVEKDPDLAPLRRLDRFKSFTAGLFDDRGSDADVA